MPEGPEIRRAAEVVAAAIAGCTAQSVEFGLAHLHRHGRRLTGRRVRAVEFRGKALLIHFGGAESIYTHNQLYGEWRIVPPGARPASSRQLRLAIDTRRASALLYSASDIEVLPTDALRSHRYLAKLGVELLAPATRLGDVRSQLDAARFAGRTLAALLLDQTFLAGVGNYLRSEILFVAGLDPQARLADLGAGARARLARAALALTRQAYRTGGITNDLARARRLRRVGLPFDRFRHHVFDRAGEPCWHCQAPLRRETGVGRNLFRCPRCQARDD